MSYGLILTLTFIFFAAVSYLLGSINFAIIITKAITGRDIRNSGSGNAGMTNVMRVLGFWPGFLTFVFDFLKAVIAVLLGKFLFVKFLYIVSPSIAALFPNGSFEYARAVLPVYAANLCGIFCILGHFYPIFFKFKGGKGIASTAGVILVTDWRIFLILFSIFAIVFLIFRIISVSSLTVAVCYPIVSYIFFTYVQPVDDVYRLAIQAYRPLGMPINIFLTLSALILSIMVIIKHSENIKRLIKGEEKKFEIRKTKAKNK